MRVTVSLQGLKDTHWNEYLVRFLFGGFVAVLAGAIAQKYGPIVGGLFLAFPAIFPASATLVEEHERKKKEEQGKDGRHSGIDASGIEASGAAIGSVGLMAFGMVIWGAGAQWPAWVVLTVALLAWAAVSTAGWVIRQRM